MNFLWMVEKIVTYWVSNEIDQCLMGFLHRHLMKNLIKYDGVLAQVTKVFTSQPPNTAIRKNMDKNSGHCKAALIFKLPVKKAE